jgi:hypothetical protein
MAKWDEEKMADLTRKLADTAIDYKTRCEELEAKVDEVFAREIQRVKQIIETYKPPHSVPLFIVIEEYELMWSEITGGEE